MAADLRPTAIPHTAQVLRPRPEAQDHSVDQEAVEVHHVPQAVAATEEAGAN